MKEFSSTEHQRLAERLERNEDTPEQRVRLFCELAYELRNNATLYAKSYLQEARNVLQHQHDGDIEPVAAPFPFGALQVEITFVEGVVLACNSEYDGAFEQLSNALQQFRNLGDVLGESRSARWLGVCNRSIGMMMTALDYYQLALAFAERSHDVEAAMPHISFALLGIGDCYALTDNVVKANDYHFRALDLAFETDDKQLQAQALWSVARLYEREQDYDHAYEHYLHSYKLRESLHDAMGMGIAQYGMGSVLEKMGYPAKALRIYLRLLREFMKSGGVRQTEAFIVLEIGELFARSPKPRRALPYLKRALAIAEETNIPSLRSSVHEELAKLYKQLDDYVHAVYHFEELHRISQELVRRESLQTTQYFRQAFDFEKAQQQAEVYRLKHEELTKLNTQNEDLLRNMLPEAIAERIRRGETMIAEHFTDVTVLFADIVGFTELSAQKSPEQVVDILNRIFSAFDIFSEQYNLEKIKTIGDAYMIVGGVPEPSERHTVAAAQMALEMQATVRMLSVSMRIPLAIRVGFHVGPVVAGVIGQKKIAYDLWGDTVNTASRMEAHSEAGKIHVTHDVFMRLKAEFMFEERGEIEIKGKGMMATYFLLGKR
jgi:class 3 adenylate cyclase